MNIPLKKWGRCLPLVAASVASVPAAAAAAEIESMELPLAEDDNRRLQKLAVDASPEARSAFVSGLESLLERASPLDRAYVVATWSVAEEEPVRLAIARALSAPVDAVGARTAVGHLMRDPSAEVRSAALCAARRLRVVG
jgi:hypothetical protein